MPDALSPTSLTDAERHCLRHAQHVVVRGSKGKMTTQVIGGDAGGVFLRRAIASADEAKSLFADYDLRLDVSP